MSAAVLRVRLALGMWLGILGFMTVMNTPGVSRKIHKLNVLTVNAAIGT